MAQAVFNHKVKKLGLSAEAFSRGLCAGGTPMSENAKIALTEMGIKPHAHVSKTVTAEDIKSADLVIGISSRHAASLIAAFPKYCDKICAFPFDVPDPYGGNVEVYKKTLAEIIRGTDIVIREVFPECP